MPAALFIACNERRAVLKVLKVTKVLHAKLRLQPYLRYAL